MGAIEAAKNANRLEEIKFITFDTDEDVIAGIQSGEVFATGKLVIHSHRISFSSGYVRSSRRMPAAFHHAFAHEGNRQHKYR